MKSSAKEKADALSAYVFFAGFAVMAAALAFAAFTKKIESGAKIFVCAGWIIFAVTNAITFYTGEFKWKGGPTFTREKNPLGFYVSWIPFTLGSMGIATFLVFKALATK